MKRSRFTEEQIIGVLREQEAGMNVAEVCRRHGISQPTFYAWKAKFGGMSVSDAKRLKQPEEENARLKKLLEREEIRMNHKRLRRLHAEERLQVRRRGGRKRALGMRAPMTLPQGPDQRWSPDLASDTLTDGRRFRILVVVDDFTRECLGLVADTSLSGKRVVRELDAIIAAHGAARVTRFVSVPASVSGRNRLGWTFQLWTTR
jgi:transposase InsO family protein